ncbi:MAG: YIP1 family protein [Pseudomonadota bacterium]
MAVTTDIVRSYRRPRHVFAGQLAQGSKERIALAYLALAMILGLVSQLPSVSRRANVSDPELEAAIRAEAGNVRQIEDMTVPENMIDAKFEAFLSAELMVWLFILPLIFYGLSALSVWIVRLCRGQVAGVDARLALFWALVVATPLKLLHGLVYGMIGPGAALTAVGFLWCVIFLWNWSANLREAGWASS